MSRALEVGGLGGVHGGVGELQGVRKHLTSLEPVLRPGGFATGGRWLSRGAVADAGPGCNTPFQGEQGIAASFRATGLLSFKSYRLSCFCCHPKQLQAEVGLTCSALDAAMWPTEPVLDMWPSSCCSLLRFMPAMPATAPRACVVPAQHKHA